MQTSVDENLDRLIAKRADRGPDPDEQEQAERSGDKLLACAACHRGIALGVQGVVDSYLAARPSESRAREAYTAAHREVSQSRDVGSLLERALTERALSSVEQSSAFGAWATVAGVVVSATPAGLTWAWHAPTTFSYPGEGTR